MRNLLWGYSSVGRAPALQAGGHEFESRYLHENVNRATAESFGGAWQTCLPVRQAKIQRTFDRMSVMKRTKCVNRGSVSVYHSQETNRV